nr:undecaprenyl diphosphate synthase family protein [Angustibacter aerolatus]
MDGNGRWANQQGLTRTEGHAAGSPRCSTSWPEPSRSASGTCRRTPSPPRTGAARRRRCAG